MFKVKTNDGKVKERSYQRGYKNSFVDEAFRQIVAHGSTSKKMNRNIVINSSEFAISQVNSILEEYYPEAFKANFKSIDRSSGMNNVKVGNIDCIGDYKMTQWIWGKTVELLNSLLQNTTCNVMLDIIVNDFVIKPEYRQNVKEQFPLYFPIGFRRTLKDWGMTYFVNENLGYIRNGSNRGIPLGFTFESTLRNKARKRLKSLLKDGVIMERPNGLCVELDNDELNFFSTSNFTYRHGDLLFLSNQNQIPLCSSILLVYFLNRRDNLIINIADYKWKCGYRRGALALNNILDYTPSIHNFFYIMPEDRAFVYDVFSRRT